MFIEAASSCTYAFVSLVCFVATAGQLLQLLVAQGYHMLLDKVYLSPLLIDLYTVMSKTDR